MPPPHQIFAPSLRGFPPWLSRNVRTASRLKGVKPATSPPKDYIEPTVKYFEETPDGERREMLKEDDEEAFMESLATQFGFGETEKEYLRSTRNNPPVEEDGGLEDIENAMAGRVYDDEDTRDMATQTDRLDALITKLKVLSEDGESPYEERRRQIRELLFDPEQGVQGINRGIASGQAMKLGSRDGTDRAAPKMSPKSSRSSAITEEQLSSASPHKDFTGGSSDIEISLRLKDFPPVYQHHIQSLQANLLKATAKGGHTTKLRKSIWSAYIKCRSALISRPGKVPWEIWSGLWDVLSNADPSEDVDRMAHIKYLGDDICKVGIQMDAKQCLLYVESLLVQGDVDIAAGIWEKLGVSIQSSDNAKEYWKLGVNIFCRQDRLDRALQIASVLLKKTKDVADYRILLPIIQACLVSKNIFGVQMAWALYIRLRVRLGPQLDMNDYDILTLSFLEANRPDLAGGVFKDMMLTEDMATVQDSTSLYSSLTGTKDGLKSISISDKELELHKAAALTKLPSQFRNKFFFGSWLKKLIGEGQLDAAQKVLQFTSDIGICPDARHMNGLIGALFREGSGKSMSLAEDMAWKMVNTRLVFVKSRTEFSMLKSPLRAVPLMAHKPDVKHIQKTPSLIPRATIETFCILIRQYRTRQKTQALLDLFDTLRKAEIPPNTDFMNELLNMDSRSHKTAWAWNTYLSLTKSGAVRPNYETFTILYNLLCQSLDPVQLGKRPKFTTPHHLFVDMIKYKACLKEDGKVPRELYDAIILAFGLAEDQAGTAVALIALRQHFDTFPGEQTARTIILQLTRLGQTNKAGYKSRRLNVTNRLTKERYAHVTKILQRFRQERVEELLEQGIVFEELSEEEKLHEAMMVLSDLLRHAFQSKIAPERREILTSLEVSKRTAEAMGVPECIPWDGLAVVEASE
ncbi:hypothetical protein LHYA1_G005156 [Lachnellula hyalina]|uniref:Pentatricopeptide repeat-containing protein n=1 Tax=Lachnellula hyalina TaxID=1316788 RepID=A0A8H8QYB5_9HELO|nr:uncharacterized protein LHYA1_G005156 [Lachnellula hyalina]TVY24993.1 hypothetical protein LHYA1_G005156 [Lachnellula hyalina]